VKHLIFISTEFFFTIKILASTIFPESTSPPSNPFNGLTTSHVRVIIASSLGTVFEWYDFFLYGSLASIIAEHFFTSLPSGSAFVMALFTFAAGFAVRPFGAIVFGRLGDKIGRKYTFLITIIIMGASTFLVGKVEHFLPCLNSARVSEQIEYFSLWGHIISGIPHLGLGLSLSLT
jgi:MFS family permease